VSPILVRPVREQLEHDRIIRLLQTKFKRRFDAGMNPGAEQNAPLISGTTTIFPDLVLTSLEKGHRLQAVVEVETAESVNHLEALAEWMNFAKLRAAFYLYVPSSMVDVARRLCDDNQIVTNEIWSYHTVGDEVRFTLVHRAKEAALAAAKTVKIGKPTVKPTPKPAPAAKPARTTPKPARPAAAPRSKAKPAARALSAKPAARGKTAKKAGRTARRK
jgi:hypothetical protein